MSQYKYIFINKSLNVNFEATGYNLFNAAEKVGIRITRVDRLNHWYLQETKFEDRVRTVWGVLEGSTNTNYYDVKQKYNN